MCHVLVIEDDFLIAEHIIQLAHEGGATSIAQADTQEGAITAARSHKPDVIMSDVKLTRGTGPLAVQAIIAEHGATAVIFITGSPESCRPCESPAVIITKPIRDQSVVEAFRRLAPQRAT